MQSAPKKPSILGPIISGVTTGLGAYQMTGGTFNFGGATGGTGIDGFKANNWQWNKSNPAYWST